MSKALARATNYESAKLAIAACATADECKEWQNRAAAMKEYARQANDEEMVAHAHRIKARAIFRCGELALEVPKASGGDRRSSEIKKGPRSHFEKPVTREQFGEEAGLSTDQLKQAMRFAKVPKKEFEAAVDARKPMAFKDIEALGTKRKPTIDLGTRSPADYREMTQGFGMVRHFAENIEKRNIAAMVRGSRATDRRACLKNIEACQKWLSQLKKEVRT